mgnify:CR=1 FL=1
MSNITQVTTKNEDPKQFKLIGWIQSKKHKGATQKNNHCVSAVFYLASIAPSLVEFISMNLFVAILREDGNT